MRITAPELVNRLFPVLFLTIGVLMMFHPMILSGLARVQTDAGDPRYSNYMLEHSYQWISGNPLHTRFWDPPFFFPAVNTAAYSEILLGAAPFYWLFRVLGLLPDTAFQFWMMTAAALNFLALFFLLRRCLEFSSIASTAGAYVFAFAGMRVGLLNGPQLLPQFFSVFAVACLFKIFLDSQLCGQDPSRKKAPWIMLFFFSSALQLYAGFYLGFFLCFGLLVSMLIAFLFRDARQILLRTIRENLVVVGFSAVACIFALSWMARHYVVSQLVFGSPKWTEVGAMLPHVQSWINMGPANWLYGWSTAYLDLSRLPDAPEQRLGPGLVTLAVALVGFWRMRSCTWGRIGAGVFVVVLACSLVYPWDWTPWEIVYRFVPGAGAIRCVTRICLMLLLPFSLAVAYALDGLKARNIAVILCFIMALEQAQTTSAYDKHVVRSRVQAIARAIPSSCKAFYFVTSPSENGKEEPWFELQLDGMWAQTLVNVPTVNGFSGHVPLDWGPLGELMIHSPWDLLVAHVNACKWSDFNGLSPRDLCVVAALRSPLAGAEPDLSHFTLDLGESQARPFLGQGWGDDEWDKGLSWVWAVGTQADLYIPLKPDADYTMELVVGPMDVPGRHQSIAVQMNGTNAARVELLGGMKSYTVTFPASMVKEYNKVTFRFDFAVSPAILGRASDDRPLAAAFDKIYFVRSRAGQLKDAE